MQQLFYYKMREKFITKCVRFFITKYDSYYKMRRLLQITDGNWLAPTWNVAILR